MKIQQLILERRSIRDFQSTPIEEYKLKKMLEAGFYAPTARNLQPNHFIVIRDRQSLDRLSEIHPYANMLKTATAAILVCGDRNIEKTDSYNAQNGAAATQNILLSAFAQGIGSCWLGVFPREERMKNIAEFLELPEEIIPISLIALGYPNEQKQFPNRFDACRIHYEKWGNDNPA